MTHSNYGSLLFIALVFVVPSALFGQANIHSVKMEADAIEVGGELESGMFTLRSQNDGTGEMLLLPNHTAYPSLLTNDEGIQTRRSDCKLGRDR